MVDVFISYSRAARAKAEAIKSKLESLGLDCFLDLEKIDGGANFPDIIDRALRGSKAVLCCWSPVYFDRPWCMIECRDGLARGILIPVAVEPFETFAPPADLRQINWFDLAGWDGDDDHEGWTRTLRGLEKLIGRELVLAQDLVSPVPSATVGDASPADVHSHVLSDLRATWTGFPAKSDARAVERLLDRVRSVAAGSGLEFEIEHHLDELKLGTERQAQEALRAEAARREREAAQAELRNREAQARARPGSVWRDAIPGLPKNACPEMITIPPGAFAMGTPGSDECADQPQHDIHIDYPFALGNYVVTFAEWDAAIAVGARLERPVDQGWGRDHRPVINVSWESAKAYIAWLNGRLGLNDKADAYRLPSEAEWEYACRAGTATDYSFGDTISASQAHHSGEGQPCDKTAPVGSFPANSFGLHDMHGNVWEWCEDVWNVNYSEPDRTDDGSPWLTGAASRRVVRGGSWECAPTNLRSAARRSVNPISHSGDIGFRLARTLSHSDR